MFLSLLLRHAGILFRMTHKDPRDVSANLAVLIVSYQHHKNYATARLVYNSRHMLVRWSGMVSDYKVSGIYPDDYPNLCTCT